MKRGEFLINNIHCSDINSIITSRPVIPTPMRKRNLQSVPYRSGLVVFDENAYDNVEFTISFLMRANSEAERDVMRSEVYHAFDSESYIPFTAYFNSEQTYEIVTVAPPEFQGNYVQGYNESYTVSVSAKPFKIIKEMTQNINGGGTGVYIDTHYPVKPIFTVVGNGQIELNVNGKLFLVNNIQTQTIIDCTIPSVYNIINGTLYNEENKAVTREFPIIKPGMNTISWNGLAITSVTMGAVVKTI